MTAEEWLAVDVGTVIRDHHCGGAIRIVQSVSRVSGRRGQRGKTRTMATVNNLKSVGSYTYIISTEDCFREGAASPDGKRFELVRHYQGHNIYRGTDG